MMNTRVEMNEDMMMQVNGGMAPPISPINVPKDTVHKGCGGHIIYNLFDYCVCDKCGERNFWYWSFDTEDIW